MELLQVNISGLEYYPNKWIDKCGQKNYNYTPTFAVLMSNYV